MKNFNDMYFGSDNDASNQEMDDLHNQIQFEGFDE